MAQTPPALDDAVLRAVAAFLDDEYLGGEDLAEVKAKPLNKARAQPQKATCNAMSTVSLASAVVPVPPPHMINRSRIRRRHELESLREQVVALQEILDDLNNGNKTKPRATKRSRARAVRVGAWRAIAECQLEQLREAERERNHLRLLVRKRKTIIRRIERFLNQRMLHEPTYGLLRLPMPTSISSSSNLVGFEDFSRNLLSMYTQVGHIFEDPRFESLKKRQHEFKPVEGYGGSISAEMLGSVVLPFDIRSTADAVWRFHFIKAHKVAVDAIESLEEKGDVLRRTLKATMRLPSMNGVVSGRMETRRIIEQDKVVIIQYASFDEVSISCATNVNGFSIRQLWWTLVRPPRNEKYRHLSQPLCQVDSFSMSIPSFDEHTPHEHRELINRFCIEAPDATLTNEYQSVENLLLVPSMNEGNYSSL